MFGIRWYTWNHQRWFRVWGISFSFKSWVRALYGPSHHGSGWHIGSEVWVSFALGLLDHYLHHRSHHIVTCFDLAFLRWVVRHCHTLLHLFPNLFLHFPILSFIIRLIPLHLQLPSLIIVSLHERWVLWCMSPIVWCFYLFIFGYRVESPHSHGSTTFDIAHTGVWHYLLGDLGHCFPSFHSPFTPTYITVQVIKPPWGHEISCLLRCSSFRQAPFTDWVWDVRRSPLLWGISRVTYFLSIQFTCLRSVIRDRWYKELGPLRAPSLDVLTCSYGGIPQSLHAGFGFYTCK